MGVLGEAVTQIVIPVAAIVGIGFALLQWFLVSKVRVSAVSSLNNGYKDSLIADGEEEEGIDTDEVVDKCADIQNAISVAYARKWDASKRSSHILLSSFSPGHVTTFKSHGVHKTKRKRTHVHGQERRVESADACIPCVRNDQDIDRP